jgi:hypothetical protein
VKKSVAVPLTLVATFAAALACGSSPEERQCVDAQERVVPDSLCARAERERTGSTGASTSVARGGSGIGGALLFLPYRYYYGGSRRAIGSVVTGGGYSPRRAGGLFSSGRSGTARGGFGAIGSGRGIGG